ncbi:MAG TPA: acetate/propionate family kinase [Terracidiphilus sp.]|nr:acetate/propionate family kinase [Terracidiphilus sp.]
MKCLIPNIGSTSFKYRVLDMPEEKVLASGRVERIGQPGGECPDYPAAIHKCLTEIAGPGKPLKSLSEIWAVGFKAVHAGPLNGSQIVDDRFLAAMEEFAFITPAHNPPYIAAMRAFRQELPGVPLVAVLETSPYRHMNEAATTYAVPYEWRRDYGIRRYGFHGASHRSASERTRSLLGRDDIRHISCHLGGSSSVAAFRNGVAVETSFGASPQSGLPQNNRVGDIDAFAVLHMMKKLKLDPEEMAELLGSKSGLAGISGTSGDVRDLTEAAASGNHSAQLALDVFVYSIRHYLGAFMLELGGLDAITFSGGIGENGAQIRAGVLKNLGSFGIELDDAKNKSIRGEGPISTAESKVKIFVVPANEEIIVARETVAVAARANQALKRETQAAHAS